MHARERGKSGSKTQECENRLLSAFPGENGSRRGRSLPRRWQPRPDALSENRGFNSRPPIVLSLLPSPRPVAAILDRERDPTPYRFSRWKRKFGYLFSLHRKQDLSLFLFDFVNSTRLTFNVTNCRDLLLSIIIHRIPLKGGRSILLPFEGPSKQEWIDYYARRRVHNSMYASTLNRPIKWRKSSLLTLALMSSTLSKIRCYILAQSMIVDDRF